MQDAMEWIKVLWMNNGDNALQKYVNLGREYNIDITTCNCMKDCRCRLHDPLESWDAVMLNMEVKIISCNEKASSKGLLNAIQSIKGIPCFIVTAENQIDEIAKYSLEAHNKEPYFLNNETEVLFEHIRIEVSKSLERRYAKLCDFCGEKEFKKILTLIDRADIRTDTSIPNRCRQMLEWVKDSNIFESELKGLSLNDFSRYMGNAINLPEYVKRSLHACVSISNQGSHFTDTTKMISGGDAPYLTKSLIYDLLNILDWCASQNGNIFIPKYKTDKTNKHDWKQFEN